jgi:hypothetical protein
VGVGQVVAELVHHMKQPCPYQPAYHCPQGNGAYLAGIQSPAACASSTGTPTAAPRPCRGGSCTSPGGTIPDALKGVPTHPYAVYEILWDLALLGVLRFSRRRFLPGGSLFAVYVWGYALGRFSLTFVRQEAALLWGLQQAQVVALVALAPRRRPIATRSRL